ncbi:hypothetical protein J437_LFUL017889 [Ladona fulva]|uniref:Uncharacterized protein n=1 Tax=Ladona fulva TaxID=123851 RepID=A0A8K0K8G3_LADFU|nr:hypothetical protein J437_LFUL017889 [Ladona fulva]
MQIQLFYDEEARHFAEKLLRIGEGTNPIDWLFESTTLAVRKEVFDDINLQTQNKILDDEKIYKSIDSMADTNEC